MKIRFRTVTGKIFDQELFPEETIADAKVHLQEEECFDCSNSLFILGSRILKDETKIGTLNVPPLSYIIIHPAVKPKASACPGTFDTKPAEVNICIETAHNCHRCSSPSPQYNDPPNFAELVTNITDIGFSKNQATLALRRSHYNADRAVNLLFSEQSSVDAPKPVPDDIPKPDFDDFNEEKSGAFDIEPLFSSSSKLPAKYGELQGDFDSLTPDEKAALSRLEKFAFDSSTILQIFIACDKNESSAEECIKSMMS